MTTPPSPPSPPTPPTPPTPPSPPTPPTPSKPAPAAATTTPAGRLRALARAELTLLTRNKGMIVTALFVPLALPFSVRPAVEQMDLRAEGLTMGAVMLTAAIGFSLLFAVYTSLVSVFVARREELVLKRLRTGELGDAEILVGAALPAVCVGLAQSVLLAVGCGVLLDAGTPRAPHLALLGLALGLVLCAALAALTASFSRTVESAQVTALPMLFVSMLGSGIAIPTELLPDRVTSVCELLPLSPAIRLIRGGWSGGMSVYDTLGAVATGIAWVVIAVSAAGRWFRWEPRR
ncbi:ABC transporter permease [Streptomyces yaanensis]|uniref:ABC transporter permease n=1 Tax=Streptomyces yaanensis TaxID=1142239 RepID=A0ABV7S8H1_9ACTN|nr:ABC transporter permease [Streptomyces sp. CGMCC 4.7035]WNC02808.1 ABC transporter permease [Streptomyces sp. CGMCC 4.7035]